MGKLVSRVQNSRNRFLLYSTLFCCVVMALVYQYITSGSGWYVFSSILLLISLGIGAMLAWRDRKR